MQTITIDILNDKAIKLLQDLEFLELIKIKKNEEPFDAKAFIAEFEGAMTRQPLNEIDAQLRDLRDSWE